MPKERNHIFVIEGPKRGMGSRCEAILRALPDWFGIEQAIVDYVKSIDTLDTFVATAEGKLVGFMAVQRHFPRSAELHVVAVAAEFHRQGVGRALLQAVESQCRADGVVYLQVKTLSPSRESAAYAETRRYYEAMGFEPLEEFPKLWGPENPALQLIKSLA